VGPNAALDVVLHKSIYIAPLLDIKTEVLGRPVIQRHAYYTLYVLLNALTVIFINIFENGDENVILCGDQKVFIPTREWKSLATSTVQGVYRSRVDYYSKTQIIIIIIIIIHLQHFKHQSSHKTVRYSIQKYWCSFGKELKYVVAVWSVVNNASKVEAVTECI
jgi:hypothetical protein